MNRTAVTTLFLITQIACGQSSTPPWELDVQGDAVVDTSVSDIDSSDVVADELTADARPFDTLPDGQHSDVNESEIDQDAVPGDVIVDGAVGDSVDDADAADAAFGPDPVCPPSEPVCTVMVYESVDVGCVQHQAPDGTPCDGGKCVAGDCQADCWTGDCPSGLSASDGCRCPVVPTGSQVCATLDGFVPCAEILPGYPWHGQDAQLAGGAHAFTNNGDGTVTDTATSLVWAAAPSGPLSPTAAGEYCDAPPSLPGQGWRVPTIHELFTIVDAGNAACMWDSAFGTDCQSNQMYWSSTVAYQTANVCTVHPRGNIEACELDFTYPVRCVRGPSGKIGPVAGRFVAYSGMVYDRATGIAWDVGLSAENVSWKDALRACALRGQGWRMPTTAEMVSIIDMTHETDGCAKWDDQLGNFCSEQLYFWTSTPNPIQTNPLSAFAVHFFSGHVHENPLDRMFNVRCVKTFP